MSLCVSLLAAAAGCGDDDGTDASVPDATVDAGFDSTVPDGGLDAEADATADAGDGGTMPASVYAFESQFTPGETSVSYSGQTFRHVLIEDLNSFVGGLGDAIDSGTAGLDTAEGILAALDFYFRFDDSGLEESVRLMTDPARLQDTYGDISSTKSLVEKLAGQDGGGSRDHRDWSTEFVGWDSVLGESTPSTPLEYVDALLGEIARLGELRANGESPTGPDGEDLPPYVTADGLDLKQLLQKFLLGAVAFAQGADDYLDEGLMSPNTQAEGADYSELEHAWDEAFGYYGATRDFTLYTNDEIASAGGREDWQGAHDSDADGAIDLVSERFFGAAVNAAKRDRGSETMTEIGQDAFIAFFEGRAIIASGDESAGARARLETARDNAVLAWEQAIAATAIHYVNEVIADLESLGTAEYSFLDHAKHFGELKGFAFSFQFNPRSPVSEADFASIHALIGDRPVLAETDAAAAIADLRMARDIMGTAYAFASTDVENW